MELKHPELTGALMEALDMKENPDKNDFTIVKRGTSVELTEARDIAGFIQYQTGETTVAAFKKQFESLPPDGRLGNVIVIVSAHEKCPSFLSFVKKQARRLKFKLVVFESHLAAKDIKPIEQEIRDRGGLYMQ